MQDSRIKEDAAAKEVDTPRFKESKLEDNLLEESSNFEEQLRSDLDILDSAERKQSGHNLAGEYFHSSTHHRMIQKRRVSKKAPKKTDSLHHNCAEKISELKQENEMLKNMMHKYKMKLQSNEKLLEQEAALNRSKKSAQKDESCRRNVPSELTRKKEFLFGSFQNSRLVDNCPSKDHSINSDSRLEVHEPAPLVQDHNSDMGTLVDSSRDKLQFATQVLQSFDRLRREHAQQQDQISGMQGVIEAYQDKVGQLQTLLGSSDKQLGALQRNLEELTSQFSYIMKTLQNRHMNELYGVESDQDTGKCIDSLISDDMVKQARSEKQFETNVKMTKNKTQTNFETIRAAFNGHEDRRAEQQNMTPQHKGSTLRRLKLGYVAEAKPRPRPSFGLEKKRPKEGVFKSATDGSMVSDDLDDLINMEAPLPGETPMKTIQSEKVYSERAENEGFDIFQYIESLKNRYREERDQSNAKMQCLSSIINKMYLQLVQYHDKLREQKVEVGTFRLPQVRCEGLRDPRVSSKMTGTVDAFNSVMAGIEHETLVISYKRSYALLEQVLSSMKVDMHEKIKQSIDDSMGKIADVINKRTSDVHAIDSRFADLVGKITRLNQDASGGTKTDLSHSSKVVKLNFQQQKEDMKKKSDFKKEIASKFKTFFAHAVLPSRSGADHSRISSLIPTDKSFSLLPRLKLDSEELLTFIKNLGENYNKELLETTDKRDRMDGTLDKKHFKKLVGAQTKMHSAVVQKVQMFLMESLYLVFHANEYCISQPNFTNNMKTLKKHLEDIKGLLKKYNAVDLKVFHNIGQISQIFEYGMLETMQSSVVQDGMKYKFMFSYDITFIELLNATWISLFI